MKRRLLDIDRDCDTLVAMQRLSWRINFPGRSFNECAFRATLRSGARRREVYVYEIAGEVIGWLWLDTSSMRVAHVRHVQVARSQWDKGFGRRIMEDAIKMSAVSGRRIVTLNVTKGNARALALYTHLGFVVTEDQGERQRMELHLDGV